VVSLIGGDSTQKYQYIITFLSAKDDTKKTAIVQKIQTTMKPYVADGTIEATMEAIQVVTVEVGEKYPLSNTS